LYKAIPLPTRTVKNNFVQFKLEHDYFGWNHVQRNFFQYTEVEKKQCRGSKLAICPANTVVYDAQVLTCESSLFFQKQEVHSLCQRQLLLDHKTPSVERHRAVLVYHFPEAQEVTFQCFYNGTWTSTTRELEGSGLIHNATRCHIITQGMQVLPALEGSSETYAEAPQFFVPEKVTGLRHHEWDAIAEALPQEGESLDLLMAMVTSRNIDHLDTLLNLHQLTARRERSWDWQAVAVIALCLVTTLTSSYMLHGLFSQHLKPIWDKKPNSATSPTREEKSDPEAVAEQPTGDGQRTAFAKYATHAAE
jgi:hypothetical protein